MPISAYGSAADAMDSANLNSLANGCSASAGEASDTITELDNSTDLKSHADFFIDLASLNISSTTAAMHLFLVPAMSDGTSKPHFVVDHTTAGSNKIPRHYYAGTARFNVLNGAQSQAIRGIKLPPGKYWPILTNALGVALAASGNTLKHRSYNSPSA